MASIIRSGSIYGVANILSAGVPFLLLPILTRALTPAEYGEVVSFYMLVAITSSLAGLSLHGAVGVRWLDSKMGDPARYTASALLLALATTALAAVLAAVLAPGLGMGLEPEVCLLAPVVAGAYVIQGMRFAVWQSQEQPLPAAALQVTSALLNIALSLLAIFFLQMGGLGRIVGATLAGVIVAAWCIHLLRRDGAASSISAGDLRGLLRFGLPLVPHSLAGALLANADRFAVSAEIGASALGIYGAASQLGLVLNVIADAAIKAYTPMMYRMLSTNSIYSRLRLVAIAYLSVPFWLFIAVSLWAGYLVAGPLLLGESYTAAIDLSIWFLLGGAASGVYLSIAGLFFFTGKTEWISIATVTAAVLALFAAPWGVLAFGLSGGGATYLAAQMTLLLAAWGLSLRIWPMPWKKPLLAFRVLARQLRSSDVRVR